MNREEMELLQYIRTNIVEPLARGDRAFITRMELQKVRDRLNQWLRDGHLSGQSQGNPKLVIPPIVPTPKVYPGEPLPPVIIGARGNPQWPEPLPPEVRSNPQYVSNAVMHIFSAEETKLNIRSRQDLMQRNLYDTLENNFVTALHYAQIPRPLPRGVKERLASKNYHTANEMLTKHGY